jgi:hypothetical protein
MRERVSVNAAADERVQMWQETMLKLLLRFDKFSASEGDFYARTGF